MAYRENFTEALLLIAAAIEKMHERGYSRPVLVGGAAVELYTGSEIVSGDFDFVTQNQQVFEELLIEQGFTRPGGIGVLLRGLEHRELEIGVEVVSGRLFDGNVPDTEIVAMAFATGTLAVISVEDAIADRMAQYAEHPGDNRDRLEQAKLMLRVAPEIKEDYLDRRIREETSEEFDLNFLIGELNSNASRNFPRS